MSEENKNQNQRPSRMVNVPFPKSIYGVILAIIVIFTILFILYKDALLSIF